MSLTVIIPPTDVSPTTGTGDAVLATSPTLVTPNLGSASATLLTMSGSVHGANGTVGNPSFAFNSDQDTGLYRIGLNNIGVAANGNKVLDIATTGLTVTGALGASSLTSPAATPLTLATTDSGAAITVLSASNNVGIGTVTPAAKLEIAGTYADEGSERTPATVEKLSVIVGGGGDGATYFKTGWSNSANSGIFTVGVGYYSGGSQVRDVITLRGSTGDVSISSSTAGSAGAGALVLQGGISAGNTGSAASYFGGAVTVSKAGTTTLGNSAFLRLDDTTAGLNRTEIGFGYKGSTYQPVVAGYLGTSGSGNTRGKFYIATRDSDSDIAPTQRFEIAADGALSTTGAATFAGDLSAQRLEAVDAAANNRAAAFIRTQNNTTYSSSVLSIQGDRTTSNSSYNLIAAANGDSSGQIAVRDSGNVVNTNNSYGAISDQKLKENIVDATAKLQKLNQVRIVNFNRIGNGQKQIGVIAQELEQIFPSMIEVAIDRDAEGNDLGTTTKSVKYSVFVPMLIKAVQELTARLAALEAK